MDRSEAICLDPEFSTTRLISNEPLALGAGHGDKEKRCLFSTESEEKKREGGLRARGLFKRSYTCTPLVSIITVIYNGERHLEDTIRSVLKQTYDNIEYIIVDGGSEDGSLEIVKKYEDQIDYWISEEDGGIYDAFNKGIDFATGDFVGIINSDDYYENEAVRDVVNVYLDIPDVDIVHGDMWLHNTETQRKKIMHSRRECDFYRNMCVNHPTCFVRKELYEQYKFNTAYLLNADYDLMLYFYQNSFRFEYLDKVISHMRDGGMSSNFFVTAAETFRIRKHYFGLFMAALMLLDKVMKKIIKTSFILVIGKKRWLGMRYKD